MNDDVPSVDVDIANERVHFLAYPSVEQWAWASAITLQAALKRGLEERKRARILLSGGSTPGPVYEALSRAPLDWARIDVGLVDERWLRPDDPDSNAHLAHATLLQDNAAGARFESMTRTGSSIEACVASANLHGGQPADAVVLGMGPDGHTASLFPGMRGLSQALDSTTPYVAVDASGCPGAGSWQRRISLTPAGLEPSLSRLLLIRGEDKRKLFARAMQGIDVTELPVRMGFTTPGAHLRVHWCP